MKVAWSIRGSLVLLYLLSLCSASSHIRGHRRTTQRGLEDHLSEPIEKEVDSSSPRKKKDKTSSAPSVSSTSSTDPPRPPDTPVQAPVSSPVSAPDVSPPPTGDGFSDFDSVPPDVSVGYYYQNLEDFTVVVRGSNIRNDLGILLFLTLEMQKELDNLATIELLSFNITKSATESSQRRRDMQESSNDNDGDDDDAGDLFYLDFTTFGEFLGLPIHSEETILGVQENALSKQAQLQAFWDVNPGIDDVRLQRVQVGPIDKSTREGAPASSDDSNNNIWILVPATAGPVLAILICLIWCYGCHRGPRLTSQEKYDMKYTIGKTNPQTYEETSEALAEPVQTDPMDYDMPLDQELSSRGGSSRGGSSSRGGASETNEAPPPPSMSRISEERSRDMSFSDDIDDNVRSREVYRDEIGSGLSPPAALQKTASVDDSEVESVDMTVESTDLAAVKGSDFTKYVPKVEPSPREKDEVSSEGSFHSCTSGGISNSGFL